MKPELNRLGKLINSRIVEFRSAAWERFLDKLGKNHVSSKPFWNKINQTRSRKTRANYPTIKYQGDEFRTDEQRALVFGKLLESTFSDNPVGNEKHNENVKKEVCEYMNSNSSITSLNDDYKVTLMQVIKAIKKLNSHTAPGHDEVNNLMLKNLPYSFVCLLVRMANISIEKGELAVSWKRSRVTMIPKKTGYSEDPTCYRPISLTSCVGKLIERIVTGQLSSFLESNNLLVDEQSGFRGHRSTQDNLLFLTQKISETLARKKKCICIFFDIAKAFDKVWHTGLIHKMIEMNIPSHIIKWVKAFLSDRSFQIKVGESLSDPHSISAGVPQGAVIGPILFSIFINNIPNLKDKINKAYCLLFADDLVMLGCYKRPGQIGALMKRYLKEMESWLTKWRLKMCAHKCSYSVFSGNGASMKFELKLFGDIIPHDGCPIFLGIRFDERLTFGAHYEELRTKCIKRLNIIKIISHRSWRLSRATLLSIYYALVRSTIDCVFFSIGVVAVSNIQILQRIQNRGLKSIFKPPPRTNLARLEEKNKIDSVNNRLLFLLLNFVNQSIRNRNPLITRLWNEYERGFAGRVSEVKSKTALFCIHHLVNVPDDTLDLTLTQ